MAETLRQKKKRLEDLKEDYNHLLRILHSMDEDEYDFELEDELQDLDFIIPALTQEIREMESGKRKTNPKRVRRYHFSKTHLDDVYEVDQEPPSAGFPWNVGKPKGFWYSCGGDWQDFMYDEEEMKELFVYEITVDLDQMLVIRNAKELDAFTREYGNLTEDMFGKESYGTIDWEAVSRDYAGIEICPYIYERRYRGVEKVPLIQRSEWYYSWDVASGCVWMPWAVKDIAEIDQSDLEIEQYELEDYSVPQQIRQIKSKSPKLSKTTSRHPLISKTLPIFRSFGDREFAELGERLLFSIDANGLSNYVQLIEQIDVQDDISDAIILAYKPDTKIRSGKFRKTTKGGKRVTVEQQLTPMTTVELDFYPRWYDGNSIEQVGLTLQYGNVRNQEVFNLDSVGLDQAMNYFERWLKYVLKKRSGQRGEKKQITQMLKKKFLTRKEVDQFDTEELDRQYKMFIAQEENTPRYQQMQKVAKFLGVKWKDIFFKNKDELQRRIDRKKKEILEKRKRQMKKNPYRGRGRK